ncbi:hypothetical protein [Leuconostoc citreum]|uniref:hypothetical protein n=1 Tax=Leuconostoc citreum TaxID=33964 RepID=UPI0032DE6B82
MSENNQMMKQALSATVAEVVPFKALGHVDAANLYAATNKAKEIIENDPKWSDLIGDDLASLRRNLSVLNKQYKSLPKVADNVVNLAEEITAKLERFGGM